MRLIILFLFAAVAAGPVDAAWYQWWTDGRIVDPILDVDGNVHPYVGNNLEANASLNYADLSYARLDYADLPAADLQFANLSYAEIVEVNLQDADLTGATIIDSFVGGFLDRATFTGADLSHISCGYNKATEADFSYANLSHGNFTGTDFTGSDFTGADLTYADLQNADMRNTICTDADFRFAFLYKANFTGATDAPIRGEQSSLDPLDEMIVGGANLHGANFSGADISGAVFNHEDDALDAVGWETATWTGARFHYRDIPHFPTGMIFKDHGIVVRTPEPSAILLALVGVALVPRRRRR
ncbi:MAG: pentapeptide repeat-containing protein [Planctomycetota bacterium]|nr:pentapeptide repeat-containing protein [Planctomycetota bacterium]